MWEIRIEDQGYGMAPAELEQAFLPFVRLRELKPDDPQGTGLGLAVVQTIVKRHRGEIAVQSTPGRGSVFTVLLPALAPPNPS